MSVSFLYIPGFFALLFASCTKDATLHGKYEVAPKTISDRLFTAKMKADGRIVGSALTLNPDSSFDYITCGNQMLGRWKADGDTVFLFVQSNTYRSDSMRRFTGIIPGAPIAFVIRKGQLYRLWETREDRSIEILTKAIH
jgi:hypothetical protein